MMCGICGNYAIAGEARKDVKHIVMSQGQMLGELGFLGNSSCSSVSIGPYATDIGVISIGAEL